MRSGGALSNRFFMSLLWSFPKNTSCVFLLAYSPSGAGTSRAKKWYLNYPTIAPEERNVNRNRITRCGCAPEVRYPIGFLCRSSGAFGKIQFGFSINIQPLWGKYPFLSLSDLSVSSETCSGGSLSRRIAGQHVNRKITNSISGALQRCAIGFFLLHHNQF